ncbi:hypothetical protein [Variovorax sp. 278MFTsu5.1]|uniref:hypothetical protein n=1 Tax=Variovorax sp. 278MFTsu5.1 TaxID=3158366 RepID=UPI003AAFFE6F
MLIGKTVIDTEGLDGMAVSWLRGLTRTDWQLVKEVNARAPQGEIHLSPEDPDDEPFVYVPPPRASSTHVLRRRPGETLSDAKARWAASDPHVELPVALSQARGVYVNLPKEP